VNRARRAAVAVIAVVAVAGAPMGAAGAQVADDGDGNGTFGGTGSSATIGVWASAETNGSVTDADDPDGPRRWVVRATPDPGDPGDPLVHLCDPGPDPVTGALRFGWIFWFDTIDTTTGAIVATRAGCVPLDPARPDQPPEPVVVVPPSYGEVWRAAAIAPPTIGVNPAAEGVTGLATRLWAAGPDTVQIAATIRGYSAVGTATRVGYWFAPDDATVIRRAHGGDADDPAAAHVYERRGTYRLRAGALWTATVTVSGPGLPATTIDLGSALVTVERDYRVVEVRSRLTR
jgi:hypothetical protein